MRKLFICLFSVLFIFELTAQSTRTTFGKNRVQYHRDFDEWSEYESDNFILYWYGKSRNIGVATAKMAEYDFKEMRNKLDYHGRRKVQIIVYADVTDMNQSNIGSDDVFLTAQNRVKVIQNKVFIYFDGNHKNLRNAIRKGMATVFLNSVLYGANLQEIVQNAIALNLPDWFKAGAIAYFAEPWNTSLDGQLKDYLLAEDFVDFEGLAEENPELAGQSLWFFFSQRYGTTILNRILSNTRLDRSVEEGIRKVLGVNYYMVLNEWEHFYRDRYSIDEKNRALPSGEVVIRNRRLLPVADAQLSPDGKRIAYVLNEIGQIKVYVQDLDTGVRKVVFKYGYRNPFQATDYNYPIIAWNPNNEELAIIYEKRDVIKLVTYNLENHKKTEDDMAPGFQRVYSMDFINPFSFVLSAEVDGNSDIFIYYTKTRQAERITFDFYDDLNPVFVDTKGAKGILFSSNRTDSMLVREKLDTILPVGNFDIFFYDLTTKSKELVRVSHTPDADEFLPVGMGDTWMGYTSNESGINNRVVCYLEDYIHHYEQSITFKDGTEVLINADSTLLGIDSTTIDTIIIYPVVKKRAVSHNNTNYSRNIRLLRTAQKVGKVLEVIRINGVDRLFVNDFNPDVPVNLLPTQYRQLLRVSELSKTEKEPAKNTVLEKVEEVASDEKEPEPEPENEIDIDNYYFQSDFDEEETEDYVFVEEDKTEEADITPIVTEEHFTRQPLKSIHRIRPGRIVPYRLRFHTDFFTTEMNNDLLFEGLQSFAANTDGYQYPPMGLLMKANFKDLFEDYEIELGVRIPSSFTGNEYFLIYNDKKHRLDKQIVFYRKNTKKTDGSIGLRVPARRAYNILMGQFAVSYPLDIFRSFKGRFTLRRDRAFFLATERQAYEEEVLREQRASIRAEYVFDNTLDVQLNIKNGTRYKVYAEVVKRFNVDATTGVKIGLGDGFMTLMGVDFRHYQRLDGRSILALRAAAATSFGQEKLLFDLGSADGEIFNFSNGTIPIPQNVNFGYLLPVTNMRGFAHNIRNGNSFALANAELRIPALQYLFPYSKSSFIRNFQVVGFFDIGTAWSGKDPLSDENPLNISYFPENNPNAPIIIKVKYFRDPIVMGYGVGVRSTIFGHFFRIDYGWGIETKEVLPPRIHISLGTDF